MQPSSAKLLEDIREAAQTISEITSGKKLADYHAAIMWRLSKKGRMLLGTLK